MNRSEHDDHKSLPSRDELRNSYRRIFEIWCRPPEKFEYQSILHKASFYQSQRSKKRYTSWDERVLTIDLNWPESCFALLRGVKCNIRSSIRKSGNTETFRALYSDKQHTLSEGTRLFERNRLTLNLVVELELRKRAWSAIVAIERANVKEIHTAYQPFRRRFVSQRPWSRYPSRV